MYILISKSGLAGSTEEVARRAREHAPSMAQTRPGLKGCCGFVTAQGAAYLVGVFDDRESALQTHQQVRQWIEARMGALMPGRPETLGGEAIFHAVSHPQVQQAGRQPSLFAVLRSYHGLPGQAEAMHSLVSAHTLPAITQAPGLRGFYAFRPEDDPNRAISLTLFDSREEALRAHAEVLRILREKLGELAYEAPEVAAGETVFLSLAP